VLRGPWCTNQAENGQDLFQIEWTSLLNHSTTTWMPFKSMAPSKRNFGSPNETLEVRTKHWKIQYTIKCADSIWRPPIHSMSHLMIWEFVIPDLSLFFITSGDQKLVDSVNLGL
jgi:hypothetical protein